MTEKHSLCEIRNQIRCLENVFFNSKEPIFVEKLNVDSTEYDSTYEAKIRKNEFSTLQLLNEVFFFKKEEPSKSYNILSDLEEKLLSPDFYRAFIFDDPQADMIAQLKRALALLEEEYVYMEEHLTDQEYKRVRQMMCPEYNMTTKRAFLNEISSLRDKISKEFKKIN